MRILKLKMTLKINGAVETRICMPDRYEFDVQFHKLAHACNNSRSFGSLNNTIKKEPVSELANQ